MPSAAPTLAELQYVLRKADAPALCDWLRATYRLEPVSAETPFSPLAVVTLYPPTLADAERAAALPPPADIPVVSVHARTLHPREWTNFWRHHFTATDIGRRLRTVPVWERCPDRRRINLRIDPGLSFGTGSHFTTRYCLEELERLAPAATSMLDAGAGSGILAIAAKKLGIRTVRAFDFDPVCLRQFSRNRSINRLPPGAIRYVLQNVHSLKPPRRPYDIVCANILASILIAAAPRLWACTGRHIVLAGIRDADADAVAAAFSALGARETARDSDARWTGLTFSR